jgi:ornithine--oxo-acid transaminase
VGALLMSQQVFDSVFDSLENAFRHGSTFAPNELAMVAGIAVLEELERERLAERSTALGERLLERAAPLVEEHAVVKEARGLGLMWALEFAEPDSGSRAWRVIERVQPGLFAQLVVVPLFTRHRILTQVAGHDLAVLKILPPLVVTEEDLDRFIEALDDVIRKATRPTRVAGLALRAAQGGALRRRNRGGAGSARASVHRPTSEPTDLDARRQSP